MSSINWLSCIQILIGSNRGLALPYGSVHDFLVKEPEFKDEHCYLIVMEATAFSKGRDVRFLPARALGTNAWVGSLNSGGLDPKVPCTHQAPS